MAALPAALACMGLAICSTAACAEEANTGAAPSTQAGDRQGVARGAPPGAGVASPEASTTESRSPSAVEDPAGDKPVVPVNTTGGAVPRVGLAPGYSHPRSSFAGPLQRLQEATAQKPLVTVIEMPREPQSIGGPGRPRHALSFDSETTRKAMRSIGLEATSCALQFRAPAKLSSDGGSVDVKTQARLSCRY